MPSEVNICEIYLYQYYYCCWQVESVFLGCHYPSDFTSSWYGVLC
jgi:hypothetical protein